MQIRSKLFDKAGGSIKKVTAAESKGINYLRSKPKQKQRNTQRQQAIKSATAKANLAWQSITEEVRKGWEEYGKTLTYRNSTGHLVTYTGFNAFSRAYIVFTQIGVAVAKPMNGRPNYTGFLFTPELTVEVGFREDDIKITNNGPQDFNLALYVGKVTKETINHYKLGYQFKARFNIQLNEFRYVENVRFTGKNWFRFLGYGSEGIISKEAILTNIRN